MIDLIIVIGLVIDVIAAIMMYYGKIFRSAETIEQISKHSEHEIKHRILETRLARLGDSFNRWIRDTDNRLYN